MFVLFWALYLYLFLCIPTHQKLSDQIDSCVLLGKVFSEVLPNRSNQGDSYSRNWVTFAFVFRGVTLIFWMDLELPWLGWYSNSFKPTFIAFQQVWSFHLNLSFHPIFCTFKLHVKCNTITLGWKSPMWYFHWWLIYNSTFVISQLDLFSKCYNLTYILSSSFLIWREFSGLLAAIWRPPRRATVFLKTRPPSTAPHPPPITPTSKSTLQHTTSNHIWRSLKGFLKSKWSTPSSFPGHYHFWSSSQFSSFIIQLSDLVAISNNQVFCCAAVRAIFQIDTNVLLSATISPLFYFNRFFNNLNQLKDIQ